jgi:serine phosphatase RsbU (regulator of sigma subunit)
MTRLAEVCAQNRCESADTLLARIFAAVDDFVGAHPQQDDMTAAVFKLNERA